MNDAKVGSKQWWLNQAHSWSATENQYRALADAKASAIAAGQHGRLPCPALTAALREWAGLDRGARGAAKKVRESYRNAKRAEE